MPGPRPSTRRSARAHSETIPEQRDRHAAEQRDLVLSALECCDWRLSQAATLLGLPQVSSLQDLIRRHGLADLYAEHAHGRGRPVKGAKT